MPSPPSCHSNFDQGCGLTLTREQQGKVGLLLLSLLPSHAHTPSLQIAHKKAELQGDPSAQKQAGKGSARVADHKSMSMYDYSSPLSLPRPHLANPGAGTMPLVLEEERTGEAVVAPEETSES